MIMPVQKRAYKKQKGRVSRSKKRRTFKVQRFNALQESTLAGGDIVTEEEAPIRPSFVAADSPVNHRFLTTAEKSVRLKNMSAQMKRLKSKVTYWKSKSRKLIELQGHLFEEQVSEAD